ncbi:hypothetical protein DRQ36_10320 [bacterium]|nr:MAG: hypothetical protein DRQ36_10320 [bacterium]
MEKEAILGALDVIEDGLLIADHEYIIEYANEPAKKLLRQDTLVGRHTYEAIWGREKMEGKSPSFISFDTNEGASGEKNFADGTCLSVRSYPVDENHVVITIWDVTDYVSLERRLEEGGTDPVTGLRAGNVFAEDLEKELDRAKRAKATLALTIVELGVGEDYSEDEVETLLKKAGKIIEDTARSYDIVYRFQGDNFGILMPHCETKGASNTAERILKNLTDNIECIRPSIGLSTSENAFTGRDIHRLAERAVYVAKHRGGNTIAVG